MTSKHQIATDTLRDAHELAAEGYGIDDIVVRLGISRKLAQAIVFGSGTPKRPLALRNGWPYQ